MTCDVQCSLTDKTGRSTSDILPLEIHPSTAATHSAMLRCFASVLQKKYLESKEVLFDALLFQTSLHHCPLTIFLFQGVRGGVAVVGADHTKSNLDNIVGSLWQARQESSGSSRGDQVMKNLS